MRIDKLDELINQLEALKTYSSIFYDNLKDNMDDLPLKDSDKRTLKIYAASISNTKQMDVISKMLETSKKRVMKSEDETQTKGFHF